MKKNLSESEVNNRAIKCGVIGILSLSTIFYIVEVLVLNVPNYSWYTVISLYCAIIYLYKGIKMPRKRTLFLGILWALATIACILNYVVHRF